MCGIAGLVNRDGRPADPALLRAMTAILAHRGPDGEGYRLDGPAGLGHRRLAILDPDAGHQPMGTEDGRLWITYNGEVYNYAELRDELVSRGHRFRTASDTEVVLEAYAAFGPRCLERLRGMFAFAIWDRARRRLFLARDRVGIKPLVYALDGRGLRFASEPKALLADPAVPRELDWEALGEYLVHHYVGAPATIFAGIRKLPPASYLIYSPDTGAIEIRRYWRLRFAPEEGSAPVEAWSERLRALLADVVRRHMVSDVPLGAFLSGGLDSSSVVALMAEAGDRSVRTFSIGFDHAAFDELAYARIVARRFGTEHYEFVVKADALDALPRLAWQFDEPFGDASALPSYHLARITGDHVKVALSGDGGDESFAGYRRYAEALALHARLDRGALRWARPLIAGVGRALPVPAPGRRRLRLIGADPIERYHRLVTYQDRESLGWLLTAEARAELPSGSLAGRFRALAAEHAYADPLSALQALDVETYLPGDILVKVDRTSMLASVETRVPFLDHVLMEHVASMPSALKLKGGDSKHVLRRAMAAVLPAEILHRPKMGFGVPLESWFRGELAGYAGGVLLDDRARRRGLVRPEAVSRLLAEHRAGSRDRSAVIWSLVCLELWCGTWLDGRGLEAPPAPRAPRPAGGAP